MEADSSRGAGAVERRAGGPHEADEAGGSCPPPRSHHGHRRPKDFTLRDKVPPFGRRTPQGQPGKGSKSRVGRAITQVAGPDLPRCCGRRPGNPRVQGKTPRSRHFSPLRSGRTRGRLATTPASRSPGAGGVARGGGGRKDEGRLPGPSFLSAGTLARWGRSPVPSEAWRCRHRGDRPCREGRPRDRTAGGPEGQSPSSARRPTVRGRIVFCFGDFRRAAKRASQTPSSFSRGLT